jgi:RNA recognition motif-containing protein
MLPDYERLLVPFAQGSCKKNRAIWALCTEKGKPEMSTKLHIGNLSRYTTEADLTNLFNRVGLVLSATIPVDGKTGVANRFGFVSMTEEGAQAAIQAFNGFLFQELQLSVSEVSKGS